MNLAAGILDAARRDADRPAVTAEGFALSYRELVRRASAIAGSLRETWGLAPGDRVLLAMENCGEFFEALLGCWIAGLCAVPANAKLHPRELAYIAENSMARLCLTTPGLAAGLTQVADMVAELQAVIVTGTADHERLLAGREIVPAAVAPDDAAWLFYTSGTTGRPKGAVLTHRALLFMSHAYYADVDFVDGRDTLLHAAPLSHGSGLYALPHLLKGGHQLVLSGSFDVSRIFDVIARHEHVSFFAAPTMLGRLVNDGAAASADLRNLKTIIYGGAPMYVADLKRALALFGPRLFQLYGQGESPMTIAGLGKAHHAAMDDPRYEALLASCGYARTGVEVRVVDEDDRDVAPGEVGEIATRSDCIMTGYFGNPDATAETLRGGWLHTGDLGTMAPDGLVTLHDRSRDLIISGGANIYPREIEEVLLRHPDLLETAVVGCPDPDWGESAIAFVVARPGATIPPEALDRLCLDNIARFKRPKEYRFVDALPKNNYGKVLKTELRQILAARHA